jgi:hypothetical protein
MKFINLEIEEKIRYISEKLNAMTETVITLNEQRLQLSKLSYKPNFFDKHILTKTEYRAKKIKKIRDINRTYNRLLLLIETLSNLDNHEIYKN